MPFFIDNPDKILYDKKIMLRQARIVIPEIAHHITQRGNYRQIVFEEEPDYKRYLLWMKEYSDKYDLEILGYCLMSNHIHFIVIPKEEDNLFNLVISCLSGLVHSARFQFVEFFGKFFVSGGRLFRPFKKERVYC